MQVIIWDAVSRDERGRSTDFFVCVCEKERWSYTAGGRHLIVFLKKVADYE